jgi:hypothetical protein
VLRILQRTRGNAGFRFKALTAESGENVKRFYYLCALRALCGKKGS